MPVISIAAHKERRRERWKREILLQVEKELNKVHESNFEKAKDKMFFDAELIGEVYKIPAAELERMRKERGIL